jgi:hypothetical protein
MSRRTVVRPEGNNEGLINEADAITAVLAGTAYVVCPEGTPYTACPKCGGNIVQLPQKDDVIVECASGCDWWDVQLDTKRARRRA